MAGAIRLRIKGTPQAVGFDQYTYSGAQLVGALDPLTINGNGWVLTATGDITNYLPAMPDWPIATTIMSQSNNIQGTGSVTPTAVLTDTQPFSNLMFLGGFKSQAVGNLITPVNTLMPDGTTPTQSATAPAIEDVRPAYTVDPVLGLQGETGMATLINSLSSLGLSLYGIPTALHQYFGWSPSRGGIGIGSDVSTGAMYPLWTTGLTAIKTLGDTAVKTTGVIDVTQMQGEYDVLDAPPALPTSPALYLSQSLSIVSDNDDFVTSRFGQVYNPWHTIVQTSHRVVPNDAGIAQAQYDMLASDPRTIMCGATYFYPHDDDHLHFNIHGRILAARYIARQLIRKKGGGRATSYGFFNVTSAEYTGTAGVFRVQVPVAPVKINTRWAYAFQLGCRIVDASGDVALSNFAVGIDGLSITFDMSREPVEFTAMFRMACDYQSPDITYMGLSAMANFSDSETETMTLTNVNLYGVPTGGSTVYPLENYAIHRKIRMTKV